MLACQGVNEGEPVDVLRVRDWTRIYENHRTRELKRMEWIPVPNKMDGDGYTELVDDPNGAAHLGVWLCVLQIASKCEPRGTLIRSGGVAHTPRSIARISRIPAQLCGEAIARLLSIGWLESVGGNCKVNTEIHGDGEIPRNSGDNPAPSRAASQEIANYKRMNGTEGNGTEGNGTRADAGAIPPDRFFEERYALHPKKRDRVLAEQVLSQIACIETVAVQEKFRAGHDAWIGTDDYQWKGGAKCPTFAMFITDRTWEYLPHVTATKDAEPSPYVPYRPPTFFDTSTITGSVDCPESYEERLRARKEFSATTESRPGESGAAVSSQYTPYQPPESAENQQSPAEWSASMAAEFEKKKSARENSAR